MKVLVAIFFFVPSFLFSQTSWTLQACIDSALINNPEMRLADIDLSIANTNVRSSQWNFLPNLNGGAAYGYNWGRTIDLVTYEFANDRIGYNNFYLSSSAVLFSGLQKYTERKISNIDQKIVLAKKEIENRNVTIQVLAAYLQVKLNEEIVSLKNKHLLITKDQVERAKILEKLESDTGVELLKAQAQSSKDHYELIQSQNDLKISIFLLQSLIGVKQDSTFSLADSISLKTNLSIDENQLNNLQTEKKLLESKQIRGSLSPSLSLNGSIGSGYSENNKTLNPNGEFVPRPFNEQLDENFFQSLSLTLSVPIFNGVKSYSQIKINQKELDRVQIENEKRALEFDNTRLKNRMEVKNQQTALTFAQASLDSYKVLFENSSVQYLNGAINYAEYLRNKDAYLNAESVLIQAKYRLKFAEMVQLNF